MNISIRTVLLALSFALPTLTSAADIRRDGNWWRSQPNTARVYWVAGFFDGMDLGNRFSVWKYLKEGTKEEQACAKQATVTYQEFSQKYVEHVTAGQLADGLENFYSDYRNRRIELPGAVWLVLNGIAGTPKDELNRRIDSWREGAGRQ